MRSLRRLLLLSAAAAALAAVRAEPAETSAAQERALARTYSAAAEMGATSEESRGAAEQALTHARRAAELEPGNAANWTSLAIVSGKLALLGDLRERVRYSRDVREQAERALELDPQNPLAHHVLGRWHHEVAELGFAARLLVRTVYGGLPPASLDDAIRHLETATQLDPDNPLHLIGLGFAYRSARRTEDASRAWQRGLALPAHEPEAITAQERARDALERLR